MKTALSPLFPMYVKAKDLIISKRDSFFISYSNVSSMINHFFKGRLNYFPNYLSSCFLLEKDAFAKSLTVPRPALLLRLFGSKYSQFKKTLASKR